MFTFLGNSSPPHLTPPLAAPQGLTEWSLGTGETKMAPDHGAFVQLQIESGDAQGFCKNAAWSFSSVVY